MSQEITKRDSITEIIESNLFGSKHNTSAIISRSMDEKLFQLKTLTQTDLAEIANFMPEVNRATNAFGKTQSQFMNNVMTISSFAPYRNLRQCLSEIERRRQALKENVFKSKKQLIELAQKHEELAKIPDTEENKYKIALLQVEIVELDSAIADARLYIEGALKTIMSYQKAYQDIMQAHNIPPDWDEKSFEEDEERHHITKAFQQAHADMISTGRISQGNHEYMWQCGINPQSAFNDLARYIAWENEQYTNSGKPKGVLDTEEHEPKCDIDSFVKFLNDMYEKYKGSSRKILSMKGITQEGYYDQAVFRDLNQKMDL